jgi:nitrogen fixation protein FixH
MKPYSAAPATNLTYRKSTWIPAVFVAAFLVVIAVNAVLIFTAVKTFSGLETGDAYERGLTYNQTLAAAARNEQMGWQVKIDFTALDQASTDAPERRLSVRILDHSNAPVPDLAIEAVLVRPTNAGLDEALPLRAIGNGTYQADFRPSALGSWDLRLLAKHGDERWQHSERIFLR